MKTIKGYIHLNNKGKGFVKYNGKEVAILQRDTNYAIEGDHVLVSKLHTFKDKLEGTVIKIIKRELSEILGVIIVKVNNNYTIYSPTIQTKIECTLDKNLSINDTVYLKIVGNHDNVTKNKFKYLRTIGSFNNATLDRTIVKEVYKLPYSFPKKVLESLKDIKEPILLKNRIDLTDLNCITIDPETSKDFDDAVSLKTKNDTKILGVHIADVSHYVKENSPIDIEARKRCNSVYLIGEVTPMLPFKLADNICSLVPNKPRYAISVFMYIKNGKVYDYKIARTLIKNKRRFAYSEVKKILDTKKGSWYKLLKQLEQLAISIQDYKIKNGQVIFNQDDQKLILNNDGTLRKIETEEYDITHQMIEMFMVSANEIIAKHLYKKYKHVPYRTQPKLEAYKKQDFSNFLNDVLHKRHNDYNKLFKKIKGSRLEKIIIIRYIMMGGKAEYSLKNEGHANLNSKYYTHFTSPIRRYVDLIIHRMITDECKYNKQNLEDILALCNEKALAAKGAEKYERALKINRDLKNHPKKYSAIVKSITRNTLYLYVSEFDMEAAIPFKELGNKIELTKFNRCVIGNKKYCLGDSVKIYPKNVNILENEIKWDILK